MRSQDEGGKESLPEVAVRVKAGKLSKVKDSFGSNFRIKKIVSKRTTISSGHSFELITKIKNRSRIVSSSPTKMMIYLSQDKLLSPDDKRLASIKLESIPPKRAKNMVATIARKKSPKIQ